jgi:hypothetical protein
VLDLHLGREREPAFVERRRSSHRILEGSRRSARVVVDP